MEASKMIENFLRINDNFDRAHRDMEKLAKAIRKNQKKIKWLKIGCVGLALYCAGLAMELAERKRSENYLQEEIEKVGKKVDKTDDDLTELACILSLNRNAEGEFDDKSDGGSTDA